MALFKILTKPDRSQTQLAYRVKYWPFKELSEAGRELITWRSMKLLKRIDIELHCNETQEYLYVGERRYRIVWAYNNIPTELEWKSKPDDYKIICELRHSPALPEYCVAILSFTSMTRYEQKEQS
jgi:hypothetical protein